MSPKLPKRAALHLGGTSDIEMRRAILAEEAKRELCQAAAASTTLTVPRETRIARLRSTARRDTTSDGEDYTRAHEVCRPRSAGCSKLRLFREVDHAVIGRKLPRSLTGTRIWGTDQVVGFDDVR
jgi:hypothetical protein